MSGDLIGKKRSLSTEDLSLYDDNEIASPSANKKLRSEEEKVESATKSTNNGQQLLSAEKAQTFFAVCGSLKGEREEMQDRHLIVNHLPLSIGVDDIKRSALFGLFDGHAGKAAAEFCASHFADRLASNCAKYAQPSKDLASIEKSMKKIFTDSYKSIDDEFLKEAKSQRPTLKDGTTATTLLLLNDILYCANIGDSRAIVCRHKLDSPSPLPMQITIDHNPLSFNERMRIQKAGGSVKDGRVLGILEVSRSIGDGQFKAHGVISLPDIKKLTLTPDDLFVILACDGLWKVFSSEEAIKFVLNRHKSLSSDKEFLSSATNGDEATHVWQKIADELCATAVVKGCGDNVSVILLIFKDNFSKHFN